MVSVDTNLLIHSADPDSKFHGAARSFFVQLQASGADVVICELVLVELYMQLRNPAVLLKPFSPAESASYCLALKGNPRWRYVDYEPSVSTKLWQWASGTMAGFRQIIDARLAFTLLHHGVTRFATANVKHFQGFGFAEVWDPLKPK